MPPCPGSCVGLASELAGFPIYGEDSNRRRKLPATRNARSGKQARPGHRLTFRIVKRKDQRVRCSLRNASCRAEYPEIIADAVHCPGEGKEQTPAPPSPPTTRHHMC